MDDERNHPEQAAVAPVKRTGPWNSLEVAKLVSSATTPLIILAMGSLITLQSAKQAQKRELLDRRASTHRDDQIRTQSYDLQRQLQEAADKRDSAIRAAALDRDDALRADAVKRDAAVRKTQIDVANIDAVLSKRAQVWDTLGGQLQDIEIQCQKIFAERSSVDVKSLQNLKDTNEAATRTISIYAPYFSADFIHAINNYILHADDIRISAQDYTAEQSDSTLDEITSAHEGFNAAGKDLFVSQLAEFGASGGPLSARRATNGIDLLKPEKIDFGRYKTSK